MVTTPKGKAKLKDFFWRFAKSIFLFLFGFGAGYIWYELNESKTVWKYSDSLSFSLYIASENIDELINKIDVIQIFEDEVNSEKNYFLSTTINERKLVFDSRDKNIIRKIIAGFTYDEVDHENNIECNLEKNAKEIHVIAYDQTLFQVGYVVVNLCRDQISKFAQITYFTSDAFTNSLSTSRQLPIVFQELGII